MKKLISLLCAASFFVTSTASASNLIISESLQNFSTNIVEQPFQHAEASFRLSIDDHDTKVSVDGTLDLDIKTDETFPGYPKIYEIIDFNLNVRSQDDSFETNTLRGSVEVKVIGTKVYMNITELEGEGFPISLMVTDPETQNMVGRWLELSNSGSIGTFDIDVKELQKSNTFDPYRTVSEQTDISEEATQNLFQNFFDRGVLKVSKDPLKYKGYSAYSFKINKNAAFDFFKEMADLLHAQGSTTYTVADVFDVRKMMTRSKSFSGKILIDEAKDMFKGFVFHFGHRYVEGTSVMDIALVGDLIFQNVSSPFIITAPRAVPIEDVIDIEPLAPSSDPLPPAEDPAMKEEMHKYIDDDAVLGDPGAPVTIVEFGDYECIFCKKAYDTIYKNLHTKYIDTGKVKYVYRDFPLAFHPNARNVALAAECAGAQGKYFEMHDLIFENHPDYINRTLEKYATDVGVDLTQYRQCFEQREQELEIDKDIAEGKILGVQGTPTFFINGRKVDGAIPWEDFMAIIEEELAKTQ